MCQLDDTSKHKIVLGPSRITINEIEVSKDRFVELLLLLGTRLLLPDGEPMTGTEIAGVMGVKENTVGQYVSRFRKWISAAHEERGLEPIGEQDIIRNPRDWKGYQLNKDTCIISSE